VRSALAWFSPQRAGVALALAAAIAFSYKAILVKLALAAGAAPVPLLAMRMTIAAPLFLVALRATPAPPGAPPWPTGADAAWVVAMGGVGFYLAAILDFLSLRHLTAGLERIVLYVHPTFVVLLSAAWTGSRPSPRALGGIALAWAGLAVAAMGDLAISETRDLVRGVALVLGCAGLYALYLLGLERFGARHGTFRVAAMANLVAAALLVVHVGLTDAEAVARAPAEVWRLAALMAIASTVLPAALLTAAIARIGPGRAATMGMLGPGFASVLGWLVLGEPLSAVQLAGGALVVLGVAWAHGARATAGPPPTPAAP
jgi:drug/metabolite transporter (DMT)-like permease